MNKGKQIYEGKAKILFETEDPNQIIIHFKDDATAFNGVKKSSIQNKGILNTAISTYIYTYLKKQWIPTHFIKTLNETDQLCEKVEIIPLEVIVRNVIAGSLSKKLNIAEGTKIDRPIFEICYKNDDLGDPMINDDHALAIKLLSEEELTTIKELTAKINTALKELFDKMNIVLVDFKIEFGRTRQGNIVLADEISPDTCRLWDKDTMQKLDKDRFRRDLGKVEDAYQEILKRLKEVLDA